MSFKASVWQMSDNNTRYRDENERYAMNYDVRQMLRRYQYYLDPSRIFIFSFNKKIAINTTDIGEITLFIHENTNVITKFTCKFL